MRGVTITYNTFPVRKTFQLTRLMRGVTSDMQSENGEWFKFQLTRLMRGVTIIQSNVAAHFRFQLTRLMRGVTCGHTETVSLFGISTHTPHARRD